MLVLGIGLFYFLWDVRTLWTDPLTLTDLLPESNYSKIFRPSTQGLALYIMLRTDPNNSLDPRS